MITGRHLGTDMTATAARPPPGTAGTTATGLPPMTEDNGHTRDTGLHLGGRDRRPGTATINKISASAVTLVNATMSDGKTR